MSDHDTDDLGQLSGLQLEIMRAVWARGSASTAEVVETLSPTRPLAHTTIATLLSRLERRGLLRSQKAGKHLVYQATVAESEVRRSMVSDFLDRLFHGDAKALVAHLLSEREVAEADLERARQLLQQRGTP